MARYETMYCCWCSFCLFSSAHALAIGLRVLAKVSPGLTQPFQMSETDQVTARGPVAPVLRVSVTAWCCRAAAPREGPAGAGTGGGGCWEGEEEVVFYVVLYYSVRGSRSHRSHIFVALAYLGVGLNAVIVAIMAHS